MFYNTTVLKEKYLMLQRKEACAQMYTCVHDKHEASE
jgi:hypothetical protein